MIERQWKDNWRSDEAQRLYRRATARRTARHRTTKNYATDCSVPPPPSDEFTRKLGFEEQMALHAIDPAKYGRYLDWLFQLNAPATRRWGLREFLHRRDLDREREIACGEDYKVTPELAALRAIDHQNISPGTKPGLMSGALRGQSNATAMGRLPASR